MVAVPAGDGVRIRPIRKLLPDTYFYPDADARPTGPTASTTGPTASTTGPDDQRNGCYNVH